MSKYWNETITALTPYVPGEQPKDKQYIKLNTNENPYPPSPKAVEAMKAAVGADLRLYPDPTCDHLVHTAAKYYGVSPKQVFVGNGSDEILAFAFGAFFSPAKPVAFADITYSFYKVYAKLYNIPAELIPLEEDFSLPLQPFMNGSYGGIVIPNPNAPTSKGIPADDFRELLKSSLDQVVIIDEAYIDFGGESAVKLIDEFPNLLVVQTLSKSRSLAGLRVGVALGSEEFIEGLNRMKNSFNSYTIDRIALAGAAAAYEDEAYFQEMRLKVISTRESTSTELTKLGFHVVDSMANFVFVSHPSKPAQELFRQLGERGILVRYFNQPRIDNYLRITIGTDEEMSAFLSTVRELVGE
ncbi:histidinol-phosphate transaminase [Paenibacillus sp. GCM10023252]|uniref:histidinol-phosphate transaminase n=1 Tax=Paenibacillus sp. GCM10023252 TaxID=3252649 RepID=UPI00361441F8